MENNKLSNKLEILQNNTKKFQEQANATREQLQNREKDLQLKSAQCAETQKRLSNMETVLTSNTQKLSQDKSEFLKYKGEEEKKTCNRKEK
eukprot:UN27661